MIGVHSMKKLAIFAYFVACGLLLTTVTAMAYIDPSAMTYMIQLIAGVAIAAGAGASYYFRKFKRSLSRRQKDKHQTAFQPCALDDDDDTGYGDYEMDLEPGNGGAAFSAFHSEEPQTHTTTAQNLYADEPIIAAVDPFDETGGEGGLASENRELRRLLAEERQKVEELKRALHICTAPKR